MLSPACVWLYSVMFKKNVWFVFNSHMPHSISCVVQKVKYCLDMCWTTNGEHNELLSCCLQCVFLITVCLLPFRQYIFVITHLICNHSVQLYDSHIGFIF
jgi:hypothetical protein